MARFTGLLTISLLALTACSKPQPESSAPPAAPTQAAAPGVADSPAIEAALANPERLAGDREQDGWRKAADVLRFLEVRPGMRVIDYFAGGGYYTELLSRIVGPGGEVSAYNNPAYAKFAAKGIEARYAGDRLPNVQQVTVEVDQMELPPRSLDAAIFVRSLEPEYRNLHFPKRDAFEGIWRDLIQEGIEQGVFTCAHPSLTARALFGVMNWTITWYRKEGVLTAQEISEQVADLFLHGLAARNGTS